MEPNRGRPRARRDPNREEGAGAEGPPPNAPASHARPDADGLVVEGTPVLHAVARRIARQFGGHVPLDDLVALGLPALFAVARTFDPTRGKFTTYAALKIKWAILDGVRTETHGRSIAAKALALAAAEWVGAAEPSPVPGDAAALTEQEYQQRLRTLLDQRVAALAVGLVAGTDGDPDANDDPEQALARKQTALALRRAVAELPERERALIERHYYRGEPFDEIALTLGISKSWASRLHAQAIARLGRAIRRSPAKAEAMRMAAAEPEDPPAA